MSSSVDSIRRIISLALGSPGTSGPGLPASPCRPSRVSRRVSASRLFLSGPWHAKQRSERIGRISRLNSIRFGIDRGSAAATKSSVKRVIEFIIGLSQKATWEGHGRHCNLNRSPSIIV